MTSVDVVNIKGEVVGSFDLDDRVFGVEPNRAVVHQAVVAQLANQRKGTHDTKTRGEVRGGTHKMWRQKGTGRARQGSTRSPQWTGGGVVFGPVPRSYDHSLSKKVRRAALRGALSLRQQEGAITVVDELALTEFKTKRVTEILGALGLAGESVLIVIADADERLETSARNLARVGVIRVEGLNVYDVLRYTRLVLTKSAVAALEQRLSEEARKTARAAAKESA